MNRFSEHRSYGRPRKSAYGNVVLDDCNFHESVDLQDFDEQKILSFYPPDDNPQLGEAKLP